MLNNVCSLANTSFPAGSFMPAATPEVRAADATGPGAGKVGADPGAPADCDKFGVAVGAGTACVAELGRVGALVPAVGAVDGRCAFVGVGAAAACTRPFGPVVNGGTGGFCVLAPVSLAF